MPQIIPSSPNWRPSLNAPHAPSTIADLRRLIAEERAKGNKHADYELLASSFIKIDDLDPAALGVDETTEAACACARACYKVYFASFRIEDIPIYAAMARRFYARLDGAHDREYFDLCKQTARAWRDLGNIDAWQAELDAAAELLAEKPEVCRNQFQYHWGRALFADMTGEHEHAVAHAKTARDIVAALPRTEQHAHNRHKADKIYAFSLLGAGQTGEARALLEELIADDDAPDNLIDIAWHCQFTFFDPTLEPVICACLEKIGADNAGNPARRLKLRAVQIDRLITTGAGPALDAPTTAFFSDLRLVQNNFITAENLEGFIGRHDDIFDRLALYAARAGNADLLRQSIGNAYWVRSLPPREGSASGAAAARLERRATRLENALGRAPASGTGELVFHVTADCTICIAASGTRNEIRILPVAKKTVASWQRHLADPRNTRFHADLLEEIGAELLGGIAAGPLAITANPPLAFLPWHAIMARANRHCLLRPALRPVTDAPASNGDGVLCLTAEDSGLANADAETKAIRACFPEMRALSGSLPLDMIVDALQTCTLFHFAGHGIGGPDNTGALLVAGQPDRTDKKLLDCDMIRGLDLAGLDLVFLNCCESGQARQHLGQINMNMAQAFIEAGARHVLATMNPLADALSAGFAALFYEFLSAGQSVPDALEAAFARMPDARMQYLLHAT